MADPTMTAEEVAPPFPQSEFARMAASIAWVASHWAADILVLPEMATKPSDPNSVLRFVGEINRKIGYMAERAGSEGPGARIAALEKSLAAAEARALPAPRLMESLEDVEALPDGFLQYRWPLKSNMAVHTMVGEKRAGRLLLRYIGARPLGWLVGAYVSGPLPEIELPKEPEHG